MRARFTRFIVLPAVLLSACGEESVAPEPILFLEAVAPATAGFSGESAEFTFLVRDEEGSGVAGKAVTFETADGSVSTTQGVTGTGGQVTVTWTFADREGWHALSARALGQTVPVRVFTTPQYVSVGFTDFPASLPLDSTWIPSLYGETSTGRRLPWHTAFSLEVIGSQPAFAELPVVSVAGPNVKGTGPGRADLRAVAGGMTSAIAVIQVPRDRPIILQLSPTALPAGGGTVNLTGYDLDLVPVSGWTIDGAAAGEVSRTPTSVALSVAPAPVGCGGRAAVQVGGPNLYLPNGPLSVRRPLNGELSLPVGAIHRLAPANQHCVPLAGYANAEYVISLFDTRGIESGRVGFEDPTLRNAPWSLSVRDVSVVAGPAPSRVTRAVRSPEAKPLDIIRMSTPPIQRQPTDFYQNRTTPYQSGDSFSIYGWGDGALYESGKIFYADAKFAIGTLDRDAGFNIPARIEVTDALKKFANYAERTLRNAFVDEWVATTEGSGQMLVLLGNWPYTAFLGIGTGTVDRGAWIGVNPGVPAVPLNQPLYFAEHVLFHEMVHAYQDRYFMQRCVQVADCDYDGWNHAWAIEGGAEFFNEIMLAGLYGYDPTGNYPVEGMIHNVLGTTFMVGDPWHFWFSAGYASSSWFFQDLLERAVASGISRINAMSEIGRGSIEGWFGYRERGGAKRPGLTERMSALLGTTWDPADAAPLAAVALAADDLTMNPQLQVPFLHQAWDQWKPSITMVLGQGSGMDLSLIGVVWGHYRVQDPDGLGGSIQLSASVAGLEWRVVRVK